MSIQIFLDNYQNACYPGQTISGRVECFFNKEKTLRAVRVKFKGRAETQWTESELNSDESHMSRSTRYYAEEIYMDQEYNLVQGGENFSLAEGRHIYPFSYILPQQAPSSFEGSYGNVRYYIKATIDRPWKFDYEAKVLLNFVSLLDLNFLPGLKDPVGVSDEKTVYSCWCNDSGALTFNVSLPATGYVPGQDVNVGACVQNLTNVNVKSVKFKIVANYEFIAHRNSTHHDVTVMDCEEGGIGAHGEKSWTSTMKIPTELVYANLIPCSIINVRYTLVAKAAIPFPHTDLELKIPLTIGAVPLSGVSTGLSGSPLQTNQFPANNTPFVSNDIIDFPSEGGDKYPEKYPGGPVSALPPPGQVPYSPAGGPSPYPSTGGSAPYAPAGGSAPYAPSSGYPGGAPAPYPGSAPTPYLGGATAPTGGSSYPPGASGAAPYPPASNGAPYQGNSEKPPYSLS